MPFAGWEIDFEHRRAVLILDDGSSIEHAIPAEIRMLEGEIQRTTVDLSSRMLTLHTHGKEVTIQLGGPEQDAPPAGVPVVYLDQLHWVTLARQLWATHQLTAEQSAAAQELIELASSGQVVLPLAAGHLTEMGPLDGRRRRDLALTVLGLTGGWQMRNPVSVRLAELISAALDAEPLAGEVFTLQPGVLFAERMDPVYPPAAAPPELADLFVRIVSASSVYAAVLDDERLDMQAGHQAAERWAQSFQGLANWMRQNRTRSEDARINAHARLLGDLGQEIALAGRIAQMSQDAFEAWLSERLPEQIPHMPYVGRLGEVMYQRLRNADDRWERNDLVDMNFLPCAAGYADVLIGERKTIEYLRRAEKHVPAGAALYRNLPDAIEHIRTLAG